MAEIHARNIPKYMSRSIKMCKERIILNQAALGFNPIAHLIINSEKGQILRKLKLVTKMKSIP